MADNVEQVEGDAPEAEAPALPDWVEAKFASADNPIEEQARAYSEAQKLISQRGNETNELRAELDELTAFVENLPQQQQGYQQQNGLGENPLVAQYSRAFEEGDVASMLAIQAELARAAATSALPEPQQQDYSMLTAFAENQIRSTNPDYDTYREQAVEILQQNPQLIPNGATLDQVQNGILMALNSARGQAAFTQQQTQAQADAQAERDRIAKQQSQSAPGGGSRPDRFEDGSDLFEKIKAAGSGGFKLP